jgi:SOS-response transcriptional repressor LexA
VITGPLAQSTDDVVPPWKLDKLRDRQLNILRFIYTYTQEHGHQPTLREVGAAVGITSTSVMSYNVKQLQKLGFLNYGRGTRRTMNITAFGYQAISDHIPNDVNAEVVRLLLENRRLRERCHKLETLCQMHGFDLYSHPTSLG